MKAFSHVGEHASHDVALSTLVRCLESVRKIRAHGIASGPWDKREEWLNAKIHTVWQDRGAFPGAGAALEALGMRLGTSMVLELLASEAIKASDDPWPRFDAILRGRKRPPQKAYQADLDAVASTWTALSSDRKSLLTLLSRFELSPSQAQRWFHPNDRNKATRGQVDDKAILQNPYRIVEADLGDAKENPVSLGVIDRGLMPDATVAAAHPVPSPSAVGSPLDWRRMRASFVTVLRKAAQQGDSLLTEEELLDGVGALDLSQPCPATADWIVGNITNLEAEVARFPLKRREKDENDVVCLQLADVMRREKHLSRLLGKRAQAALESLKEPWEKHLADTVREQGVTADLSEPRYVEAWCWPLLG
jgi:hypothetical protein